MKIPYWSRFLSVVLVMSVATLRAEEHAWRELPLIADGQVAPGWTQIGWGEFVVDDGVLRTECDPRGLGLLLYEKEKFGNCQIRIVFKPEHARSNSGVYVRIDDGILKWRDRPSVAVQREPDGGLSDEMLKKMQQASEQRQGPWYAVHHGYEVQICDTGDGFHRTGSVYSLAETGYEPNQSADAWTTMTVTLEENRILVHVDGEHVTTFDPDREDIPPQKQWYEPSRDAPRPRTGYFGLQTHDPGDVVYFKEVSVRSLP